ncbi:MAG: cytochrome oxidase small assembly protein [Aquabacterium sp.]
MTEPDRKSNVRLALILASIALMFFVGFVTKIALFSHH